MMTLTRSLTATLLVGIVSPVVQAATTHVVNQVGTSFSPANIVVSPGDTIEWHWSAGIHTVTSGSPCTPDGVYFDSPLTSGNPLFSYVVPNDGTTFIPYFCMPHCLLGMQGTITIVPQTDACCNGTTGVCTDDVPIENCQGDQQVWFAETLCSEITCEQHTGACCDGTTGVCTDDVLPDNCVGVQQEWFKDTLCTAITCVQHTGACCDGLSGVCTNDVLPEDCQGEKQEWYKDQACQDVGCVAIPAVSQWGLVVMILLIVAAATVVLRRRTRFA